MTPAEYHKAAQRLHAERAQLHAANLRTMHAVRLVERDQFADVIDLAARRAERINQQINASRARND